MATRPRHDVAFVAVTVLLLFFTLVVLLDPRVAPAFVNSPLDLVLSAATTLVAVAVAILGWTHFREGGDRAALWRASAFLVLAVGNLFLIGIVVAGQAQVLGLDTSAPGQLPLWSVITTRGLAAVLLLVAGAVGLRPERSPRVRAWVALLGPATLLALASSVMAFRYHDLLPLLGSGALAQLRVDPTAPLLDTSGILLVTLQGGIGLAFLVTALISYRLYRRDGQDMELYLAMGFVVAAVSQVHAAIHPGAYASLVTTGDLLRVAFYAVLLLVVAAEARADIRALRDANAELIQLREVEVARATSEERARLAREIHDGMSQELWYAKLKQTRLAGLEGMPPEGRELADEVARAIESALSEARQAIEALRPAEGASFAQVLNRYVEDFSDRFGIPAECSAGTAGEGLPARHQAELLRIVQEALTNVRRHADATRIRVQLEGDGSSLRLVVADNGRGFTSTRALASRYGLRSMRERAGIIGAELHIESAPSDGTRVIVEVPVEGGR